MKKALSLSVLLFITAAFGGKEAQINDGSLWRMFVYDLAKPNQPPVRTMRFPASTSAS